MTERMIWGPGPYPVGAKPLGIIRHPVDGMRGVAILLPSGIIAHGAAGTLRTLSPDAQMAARTIGTLGGQAKSKRKAAASRDNGRKGGRPKKERV